MSEHNNPMIDMAEELDRILSLDESQLRVSLESGVIDQAVSNLYRPELVKRQKEEFKAAGLSKAEVKAQIEEFEEAIEGLRETLEINPDSESPHNQALMKLITPARDMLYTIYEEYDHGDVLLKVELMEGAQLPTRAHPNDAGMDIYAPEEYIIEPNGKVTIGTRLKIAIPEGWQLSIRPRSSYSKRGIKLANTPSTIDSFYLDQIYVLLENRTNELYTIEKGDRIAQFILEKVYTNDWEIVPNLSEAVSTSRANEKGEQGFGSSGR